MSDDDFGSFGDFDSDDAFARYNAKRASRGQAQLPDPDRVRKQQKEHPEDRPACTCGGRNICIFCQLRSFEELL